MARNSYRIHKRPAPNIELRRGRYYAVMGVPQDLQRRLGRKGKRKYRFVASLETDSLARARQRVGTYLARWRAEIAEARGEPHDDDAAFYRRALAKAKTPEQRAKVKEQIDDVAWDIAATNMDYGKHQRLSDVPEARDFVDRATSVKVKFTAHLEEWLAQADFSPKTGDMHRTAIKQFAKDCSHVSDVTHEAVQRWAISQSVSPATVQRNLGGLRGYWKYLQRSDIGVAPRDLFPFDRIELAKRRVSNGDRRLPFPPEAIPELIKAAQDDPQLADLITLAAYSGCRIEELCALKTKDVADDHFKITDAKTAAGVREVPIHPDIAQTVARLIEDGKDG